MKVFDVPIDNLSPEEVLRRIQTWLEEQDFHRIATVNPEFLLLAERNVHFKQSLLLADLRVADGVGLHLPFWLSGEKLLGHYPGVDLMHDVLALAEAKGYGVALALHDHGLSTPLQILAGLKAHYPRLKCQMYHDSIHAPDQIPDIPYRILLCNYGAPLQETYVESVRMTSPYIRLAMGVGGAFDYLTGVIPRAPKFMCHLGLEWLWRLLQQPSRFRRIWNAVVIFPMKVLSQK